MIRLASVKVLLLCLSSLGAVTLTLCAQPLPFGVEQFTSEEGLSSDVVTSLLVDSRGFLWIGTIDGLNRYDGTEFRIHRSDPSDSTSLSHNWVTGLSEDRAGRIWVTTLYGGLCRLNVYTDRFHCVSVSPEGELGLSTNEVYSAIEDRFRDGLLWLATDSGLYSYDVAASRLDRFGRVGPDGMAGPCRMGEGPAPCRYARDVYQDQSGMIWVGDWGVGLGRFDSARNRFRFFPEVLDRRPTASNPGVLSVYEAPSGPGVIWAGVRGGLRAVDAESGRVRYFSLPDRESVAWVHESFEDSHGRLWIGSDDGLLTLSKDNESLRVATDLGEGVVVRAIVEDRAGQLWLGSWGSGLYRLDPDHMESLLFHPAGGEVRSFVQWSERNLLVGVEGGVLAIDSLGEVTGRLIVPSLIPHYLAVDQYGILWIMTADAGLLRLDLDSPVADALRPPARFDGVLRVSGYDPAACAGRAARGPRIVPHHHVVETIEGRQVGTLTHILVSEWYDDRSTAGGDGVAPRFTFRLAQHLLADPIDGDRIWFSRRRGGVQRIDLESLEVVTWNRRSSRRLETNFVYQAFATGDADLMLATRIGLFRFVREDSTFERISLGASSAQSPISVFRVASDPVRPSLLWLATSEGLLAKDLVAGTVRSFTKINSKLESRAVHDLAFDPDGQLWLSYRYNYSTPGVYLERFDPETDTVTRLKIEQALDPLFIDSKGRIHLGGQDGWFTIDPSRIIPNTTAPHLAVFEPVVARDSVEDKSGFLIGGAVWNGRPIELDHRRRDIEIRFSAIDLRDPSGVRYRTFLEGYDTDWRTAGTDRVARYTNLGPGEYTFRVRAVTAAGVWTEPGVSMPIEVMPPWWRTGWAYAVYVALVITMFAAAERLRHASILRRERYRSSIRESEIRSEVAEARAAQASEHARRMEELQQAKSRFLANVSHEFRTPLTIILGLAEDVQSGRHGAIGDSAARVHQTIIRNAKRVDRLVRQLLELARVESSTLKLRLEHADLSRTVIDVVRAQTPLSERKGVLLRHQLPAEPVVMPHDPDRLGSAIGNLVSNGIKYTDTGGDVAVVLRVSEGAEGDVAVITVSDTGIGIHADDLSRVFERFERVDGVSASDADAEGVGIGLALARDLVNLHGGSIRAESEVGVGSTFWIELPIAHVEPEDAADVSVVAETDGRSSESEARMDMAHDGNGVQAVAEPSELARDTLALIVDDNDDVRAFLRDHFQEQFQCIEARDGQEGLEVIREYHPDVVVADVMMPRVDGIELCRTVKGDPLLRDIPVILLTARAGEESEIFGLRAGADEYVTKPFSVARLLQSADNLARSRRYMREDFARHVIVEPAQVTIPSQDATLLTRVVGVVQDHLSDTQFTIDALADEVGLSRRQLQRRLPDLCGESPSQFVRRMRLERACQLLEAQVGTISEVAYAAGYRSRSHFTAAFRRAYGASPSEYRHSNGDH